MLAVYVWVREWVKVRQFVRNTSKTILLRPTLCANDCAHCCTDGPSNAQRLMLRPMFATWCRFPCAAVMTTMLCSEQVAYPIMEARCLDGCIPSGSFSQLSSQDSRLIKSNHTTHPLYPLLPSIRLVHLPLRSRHSLLSHHKKRNNMCQYFSYKGGGERYIGKFSLIKRIVDV